ncbi:hypothetical protein B0H14DRAFT_3861652 [Mycena olivaceomarginata]|nr:hypothetical protein B0H14DRAFT_3861652 [Mycena olivaceomarginata]
MNWKILRTWLFVSAFHRDIAVRMIFHTLDLYSGGDDQEALNRGLKFASLVKSLRLHWAYEEGDMLDLMVRIFRSALPEFKALRDFDGWHFDAVGVSAFRSLRKFTLRAEDDDDLVDMGEVRTVLDANAPTLTHLTHLVLGTNPESWDSAFESPSICILPSCATYPVALAGLRRRCCAAEIVLNRRERSVGGNADRGRLCLMRCVRISLALLY